MTDYISRDAAICIPDYAIDEHPYDKDPAKPETFSEYNQGWHDACDFIRDKLEALRKADVAMVKRARWVRWYDDKFCGYDKAGRMKYRKYWHYSCSNCDAGSIRKSNFCANCGAEMERQEVEAGD